MVFRKLISRLIIPLILLLSVLPVNAEEPTKDK